MILKAVQDLTVQDLEVLVRYAQMNHNVERVLSLLRAIDTRIKCTQDGSERLINAADIYYIESVDKRTFVYLEKSVFQTEHRLYQLIDTLGKLGFVQISKSCILNIRQLEYIRPLLNSRMEATLQNGERLFITRKYLSGIREALQEGAAL